MFLYTETNIPTRHDEQEYGIISHPDHEHPIHTDTLNEVPEHSHKKPVLDVVKDKVKSKVKVKGKYKNKNKGKGKVKDKDQVKVKNKVKVLPMMQMRDMVLDGNMIISSSIIININSISITTTTTTNNNIIIIRNTNNMEELMRERGVMKLRGGGLGMRGHILLLLLPPFQFLPLLLLLMKFLVIL